MSKNYTLTGASDQLKLGKDGPVLSNQAGKLEINQNGVTSAIVSGESWKGPWVSGNYVKGDMVEYEGSSYFCKLNTVTNEIPTNVTYWDILAQKGTDGVGGGTAQRSGTVIAFDAPAQYGTPVTPETGNITTDATGASLGIVQTLYHNHSAAPTVPGDWVLMDNSRYIVDTLNVIFARQSTATRIEYWISQAAVV